MRSTLERLALAFSVGALALLAVVAALSASGVAPVVTELRGPRGLTPTADGGLLIAEVGAGRILSLSAEGELAVVHDGIPFTHASGPSANYPSGPSAVVEVEGELFYVVGEHIVPGFSELYRLEPGGIPHPVTGQEIVNRFPTNRLTNPYDLVPAEDGGFLISDAGINAVLHVSEQGEITDYVVFPRQRNPRPLNGFSEIDVVPTGMAYGPDGALYLASLTGFPHPEGEARVYRIEVDGQGEASAFAHGFTAATDVAFDQDGSLLVTEFSRDLARLVRNHDVRDARRIPGRLVRWRDGEITVVADGLVSPTAVTVSQGRIFVSEEFAGRVSEVSRDQAGVGGWGWVLAWLAGGVAALLTYGWVGRGLSSSDDPSPTNQHSLGG